MNNKMATCQQLNLKTNKANKKSRDRIMDMENILMVARWGRGMGEERGEGIKKYK